jgi:antitoxin MazE
MLTRIQKWGNSLGLRIPKSFAADLEVEAGSTVDIRVENGELVIRPVRRRQYDLRELLSGVNARNLHGEIGTGDAVGREAW